MQAIPIYAGISLQWDKLKPLFWGAPSPPTPPAGGSVPRPPFPTLFFHYWFCKFDLAL